ncbi:MAG: hypothetical protein PWP11_523 [Thauera sp.]|nr:glycosyltransferase family 2 protein [Thauera sp.]MDI3489246.1 hypothetical protein [Thauera sp.]
MTPLLSVIIPTCSRPKFLGRAISSVLDTALDLDIEIMVVPNGEDDAWRVVADDFKSDPRVRWLPLQAANACAARNHGLENSIGKYVRFLDDDDYLLPAAGHQLKFIEGYNLDLCSAPLVSTAINGQHLQTFILPKSADFVAAALLSISISGFTQGTIFRRALIAELRWCEERTLYDDYFWMLDVAASRELRWQQTAEAVATYVQHDGARLSRIRRSGVNSRPLVDAILRLHRQLESTGRYTRERASAVATALLSHAHSAFPASPAYLGSVVRKAIAIDPEAKPLHPLFKEHPWLARHLLTAEWAMLPARYLTRGYRRAVWSVGELASRFNS